MVSAIEGFLCTSSFASMGTDRSMPSVHCDGVFPFLYEKKDGMWVAISSCFPTVTPGTPHLTFRVELVHRTAMLRYLVPTAVVMYSM